MEIVKVTIECPKGYEQFVIDYAKEAIKIKMERDLNAPKQAETKVEVEQTFAALKPATSEVVKEIIKG